MLGRIGSIRLTAVAAIAFQIAAAGAAHAHGLLISASAACEGGPVINYTATSFSTGFDGTNPQVDIYVNGIKVATGAFVLPTNSFSGTVPAPSGTTATVNAIAVGTWGDGIAGGQSAAELVTIDIPTDCVATGSGRFTGGGSQIKVGGVRVTRGLTIHCDLLLSNNLEINWNGHQFHMEEHVTTVSCSDDPNIVQAPPAAPIDTLIGVGTGRYDNADGYTVEFTLVDAGEPGTADMAALRVYQTSNPANVVLNVPLQLLEGGNLQAHFDQPHK